MRLKNILGIMIVLAISLAQFGCGYKFGLSVRTLSLKNSERFSISEDTTKRTQVNLTSVYPVNVISNGRMEGPTLELASLYVCKDNPQSKDSIFVLNISSKTPRFLLSPGAISGRFGIKSDTATKNLPDSVHILAPLSFVVPTNFKYVLGTLVEVGK